MATTDIESPLRFVLFLDLLGFGALQEAHPHRMFKEEDGDATRIYIGVTPSAERFAQFHQVIDAMMERHRAYKVFRAMIFSDCAFIVFDTPTYPALFAAELMRRFIRNHIPVRMGLAKGTFDALRFGQDEEGQSVITRAIFSGTGGVRAHCAESGGGKGMRIFLHPSMHDALADLTIQIPVLPLPTPTPAASHELMYLYQHDVSWQSPNVKGDAVTDEELHDAVVVMQNQLPADAAPEVELQYHETLDAQRRMQAVLGRSRV